MLKEDKDDTFKLLEEVDASQPEPHIRPSGTRTQNEELLPVLSVQQQQAEQMKVFWRVRFRLSSTSRARR